MIYQEETSRRQEWLNPFAHTAIILAVGTTLFKLAQNRLIARDEGFYLLAAKLIASGEKLYIDFFFPQGPFSAWIFAATFNTTAVSWDSARSVVALLTTGTVACIWFFAARYYGLLLAFAATFILVTCNIFIVWFTTCQTYPIAGFLIVLAATTCIHGVRSESKLCLLIAGLALGAATLTRLYLIAIAPVAIAIIIFQAKDKRISFLLRLLIGITFPVLGFFAFSEASKDMLWMNLVEYHLLRSGGDFSTSFDQKIKIAKIILGLNPTAKFANNQLAFLCWLAIATSIIRLLRSGSISPWALFSLAVAIISFTPTPVYVQYFCLLVPFLVASVADDLAFLVPKPNKSQTTMFFVMFLLFAVPYVRKLPDDIERYTKTGQGVIGIYNKKSAGIWNLDYTKKVSKKLDSSLNPGSHVYAFWPGYLLETTLKPVPGFENHFAIRIADKLSRSEQHKFSIGSTQTLSEELAANTIDGILIDPGKSSKALLQALENKGFKRVKSLHYPALYISSLPNL